MIYTPEPFTSSGRTTVLLERMWPNLWLRGLEEIDRLGMSDKEAFDTLLSCSVRGRGGFLLADGEPVLIAGVMAADEPAVYDTFMQATEDFPRHYREIVRQMRRYVNAVRGTVRIYSVTVHPKSERFFRAIGFEPDELWFRVLPTHWTMRRFVRR